MNLTKRHVAALVIALVVGLAGRATAQDTVLRTYSKNPQVISGQIRLALQQEQRAMEMIGLAAGNAEVLQTTKATVHQAYEWIRFAVGGVRQVQQVSKFPDPTLPTQIEMMERARADLRRCLADLDRVGTGQVARLEYARAYLQSSMGTLNSLAVLLP